MFNCTLTFQTHLPFTLLLLLSHNNETLLFFPQRQHLRSYTHSLNKTARYISLIIIVLVCAVFIAVIYIPPSVPCVMNKSISDLSLVLLAYLLTNMHTFIMNMSISSSQHQLNVQGWLKTPSIALPLLQQIFSLSWFFLLQLGCCPNLQLSQPKEKCMVLFFIFTLHIATPISAEMKSSIIRCPHWYYYCYLHAIQVDRNKSLHIITSSLSSLESEKV